MSRLNRVLRRANEPRTFQGPRPEVDWRTPVDGRAPRLGPREYIGYDVHGRGAWKDRDPMSTPRWWSRPRWVALLGWAALSAGTGYWSWRQHGGKDYLFGATDED